MKSLSILAVVALGAVTMAFSSLKPTIDFKTTEHNFGDAVKQHQPVKCDFNFTNNGDQPLVITNVKPSCGCTTPEWPKNPIMPGESGVITAEYNAAALGSFDKTITVTSNATEAPLTLKIKGKVIAASIVGDGDQKAPKLELNKK